MNNNLDIMKKLKEAKAILSEDPKQAILLATEAYGMAISKSFREGVIKSMIILIKGNIYLGDMVKAAQLCEKVLKTIKEEEKDLSYEHAEIQICHANIYYYLGEFDLALERIIPNTNPNNTLIAPLLKAKSLTLQGNVQSRQNNYSKAFNSFRESLEIKQHIAAEGETIAKSLLSLATVYIHLNDLDKALKYTEEAGNYLKTTQGHTKCIQLLNTGVMLGKKGHLPQAIDKLEVALEMCHAHNLNRLKASALSNLGEFHFLFGEIKQALEYAKKAIFLCKEYNFRNKIYMTSLLTIFRCHHANGNLEKAVEIGRESIKICKGIHFDDLTMDLQWELTIVLEKLGKNQEALSVAKDLIELQNKIFQKKKEFDIFQIQTKLEIQMKEQESELQKELIKQQEEHNKKLLAINKELNIFTGMAAHDLNEPIRTINVYSKILKRNIPEILEQEHEYLNFIQNASERMIHLIEDLLSFARAGKSKSPLEIIDLEDIIYCIKQDLKVSIESSSTQIIHHNLPDITAHRTPILQLFQNIISNSIKYSKDGISPIIKISAKIYKNKIIITITDNGLGVSKERLTSIFEPFTRGFQKSDKRGSGIGLATCKRIVERYGGSIWATSSREGTSIHFSIASATK